VPSYFALLAVIAPVFLLIGAGVGLRRVGWLTAEADASLLKLVVNFLYPCLILHNVIGNEALRDPRNIVAAPLLGFFTMGAGIYLAYFYGKLAGFTPGHGLRTFAFAAGIYNYGYIPIPLMEAVFGPASLGVLLVHNVGSEAAIWTVGLLMLSGLTLREGWRKLINPPIIALLVAVLINTLGGAPHVPGMLRQAIALCAVCAIPLGLLLIGATLSAYLGEPRTLVQPRVTIHAVLLRLGILPVIFIALAWVLPVTDDLKRVLLVQATMPAGIIPIVIARHYGGQPRVAVQVVLATTVVALLVIPLWLRLGLAWLGS
jgi:predicted permease